MDKREDAIGRVGVSVRIGTPNSNSGNSARGTFALKSAGAMGKSLSMSGNSFDFKEE